MQNMMYSMADRVLEGFNTCTGWLILERESYSCRKKQGPFGLVPDYKKKICELDGNSKTIAAVCFMKEEMVSKGELRAVSG
ncbi:hypothetical protein EXN66_Car000797 [Channa argus]|uniref:Uncharacterized protein n=1 Tax=Channa argus TaxID=215402 RepID=A0A6G1QYQ4_CHAAH|nr:hypothetical protein EXN66_Car000797 [Channa argus]